MQGPLSNRWQQTFPLFPLTLILLDWSPGNAHALKIVIIVLSCWITCGGSRCSVNLSLHSPFTWCIRVHWLIFHRRLHPPLHPTRLTDDWVSVMSCRALIPNTQSDALMAQMLSASFPGFLIRNVFSSCKAFLHKMFLLLLPSHDVLITTSWPTGVH